MFLPIVKRPFPKHWDRVCVAWSGGESRAADLLQARYFYNSKFRVDTPRRILMMRDWQYFYDKGSRVPNNYKGWMIVGNEPDMPEDGGCDMEPVEYGRFLLDVKARWSNARTIGPNITRWPFTWLDDYLALPRNLAPLPHIWGLHLYPMPASPEDRINEFVKKTKSRSLWVTEYGHTDPFVFERWTAVLNHDKRVKMYCPFTDLPSVDHRHAMVVGWSLSEMGDAFMNGRRA